MKKESLSDPFSIRITNAQLTYCKENGGVSKVVRRLLEREMKFSRLINDLLTKSGQKNNAL